MAFTQPPIVTGGSGGSGTRVIVRVLRSLGVAFGSDLNESEDAMVFVQRYTRWIQVCSQLSTREQALAGHPAMLQDFGEAIAAYLADAAPAPGQPWGWKNPRSIQVLPALHALYPDMRFVHVVRDPRDMAFSSNTVQLDTDGRVYLSPEEMRRGTDQQMALVWQRINSAARTYGETQLTPNHYIVLRFEDLCSSPVQTIADLAQALGLSPTTQELTQAATHVAPPSSIGRWRREPAPIRSWVADTLRPDVIAFAYSREEGPW